VFEHWYKTPHQDAQTQAVYGLTELYRDQVKNARVVANPGCYTTCAILALAPLLRAGLIKTTGIIIDAASGVSGAGRALKEGNMFCAMNDNFHAYDAVTHRHTPEIEQVYTELAREEVTVQFTPHLLPVDRGILATCYADLRPGVTEKQVADAFDALYKNEYFVRLGGLGFYPEIKNVRASNFVDFGWQINPRTGKVIVLSALDNLVKGAAGQAVQNMNVMFGLPETLGLTQLPIYP
jgi:N-acetyl-gamma-glutamyl-phosphate reductase